MDPRYTALLVPPNHAAVRTQRDRRPPFAPHTIGTRGLVRPTASWVPLDGLGADAEKVVDAAPPDVEAAAKAKERMGFMLLGAGGAGALAGAALRDLPLLVRLGLAAGGIVGAILGVKNLAEGEATRQAGGKLGVTLAKCMASTIVGSSKIPL